jgi:hypothetical protein
MNRRPRREAGRRGRQEGHRQFAVRLVVVVVGRIVVGALFAAGAQRAQQLRVEGLFHAEAVEDRIGVAVVELVRFVVDQRLVAQVAHDGRAAGQLLPQRQAADGAVVVVVLVGRFAVLQQDVAADKSTRVSGRTL